MILYHKMLYVSGAELANNLLDKNMNRTTDNKRKIKANIYVTTETLKRYSGKKLHSHIESVVTSTPLRTKIADNKPKNLVSFSAMLTRSTIDRADRLAQRNKISRSAAIRAIIG